jgi:hypothetical protein
MGDSDENEYCSADFYFVCRAGAIWVPSPSDSPELQDWYTQSYVYFRDMVKQRPEEAKQAGVYVSTSVLYFTKKNLVQNDKSQDASTWKFIDRFSGSSVKRSCNCKSFS